MSSRSEQCEMTACKNSARWKGLCSTHERHYIEYGSMEAQEIVERREREAQPKKLDWEYLSDDQVAAIERGVRDAYFDSDHLNSFDLENMLQDAWIWAASNKAEVQAITSLRTLRRHASRRSVEGNLTQWNKDRKLNYLEDCGVDEDEEEG